MFIFKFVYSFIVVSAAAFKMHGINVPDNSSVKVFITKINFKPKLLGVEIQRTFEVFG